MSDKTNTKVYILGASGFLGSECAGYLRTRGYQIFDKRIDVTNLNVLRLTFNQYHPDVVINFAGVRAYPTIDWCEDHKEETVAVNVIGATNTMLAALEAGAYPIQISSGCVYSGGLEHFFAEEDKPNFYGSFYSRMRIVLQEALAELPVLYARIRMPMSCYSHPRNFIDKIVSYREVISVYNSVTLIEDLWPALERLFSIRPVGILNLTNVSYVNHKQILDVYKKFVDPKHSYIPISLDRLEGPGGITKAKRSNCVLSTEKAKKLGVSMPQLDDKRLGIVMGIYGRRLRKQT